MKSYALLSLLPPLALAHYDLIWPPPRSTVHADEPYGPCGRNTQSPSANRTLYPVTGGPIQLNLGHTKTEVQVVLAVGNEPNADSFTRTVVPTFEVSGVKNFCIGKDAFNWPSDLKDGTNATIQVITNGDPDGGLYQCADVTFTSTTLSDADYSAHCQNATGIAIRTLPSGTQANGTASTGRDEGGDDDDGDGDDDGDDDDSSSSSSNSTSSVLTTITSGGSTITSAIAATTTKGQSSATAASTTGSTSSHSGIAAYPTVFGWGVAAVGAAAGLMAL